MPYLNCPSCRLAVYTAATWTRIDECPRCGGRLGDPRSLFHRALNERRALEEGQTRGGDGRATQP